MRKLIEFFLDRALVVNSVTVAVVVLGAATFFSMNRALIPPIQAPIIEIEAVLPGASAVDTERFVTFPIEEVVRDLSAVKKIKSTTEAGQVRVLVVFKSDHQELAASLETIRTRVEQIRHRLPSDLRPVTIRQRKEDTINFMSVVLQPADATNLEQRKWIESFADHLDKIPHIVRVEPSIEQRDLYIEFNREKLDEVGIGIEQIRGRVFEYLEYQPIGMVDSNFERISVELSKGFDGLDSLEKLPILRNRVGRGPNLGDLAEIRLQSSTVRQLKTRDGQPFVSVEVFKDQGSDIINLEKRIEKEIEAFNERFPAGMKAMVNGSAGFLIERPLSVIMKNGIAGLLIVGLILFIFLGARIASMAVIGLPFVYLGTFIILDVLGISIQVISLIGMILVLGILVDDAILVSERFQERLKRGLEPRSAALEAATTLFRPVSGTIITNIVVFMPILFIKSEISTVFFAIPCVMIATLTLSLLESFFILPNHLRHFVPGSYKFKERRFFLVLKSFYQKVLRLALRLRYVSILVFVSLLAGSVFLVTKMEHKFSLRLGSQYVFIHATVEKSESLEETHRQIDALRSIISELPEGQVMDTITTAGEAVTPGGHRVQGLKEGMIRVAVDEKAEDPKVLADEVEAWLKKKLASVRGFSNLEVHQAGAQGEREENIVTIYVSGGDSLSFDELQEKVRGAISGVKNVERIFMDPNRFQKSWQFVSDPDQLAIYGIEQRSLTQQLREHFAPQELLRTRFRGDQISVFTRFLHPEDHKFTELSKLTVMTPRGIAVSLETIGKWKEQQILREIEHRDLLRKFEIDVLYNKKEVTTDEIKSELDGQLRGLREEYPQYSISVRPPEEEEEAKRWIIKVVIACVGLIYLTLVFCLGSLVQPFLVMFSIPFGFTGVVLALYTHGMPLSLMAMIGLIGLAGVVVNDSLVMVDTINESARSDPDRSFQESIVVGAVTRFKAVILTSLTTLGGVLPLAYGIGGKAGFTQPMVFALGWGLVFATLLTLFLLPSALGVLNDVERVGGWLWSKVRRT